MFSEPFERREARELGSALAEMHYLAPEALGGTQEVLACQLLEGLGDDEIVALQPRLAALLAEIAVGFTEKARNQILTEQEEIRAALLRERERAEEALRSSRDELEIVLQGVTDGITAQDPTGRLVYANEAAAGIIGYPSVRALMEASVPEMMRRFEVLDESGRPFPPERLPGRRALRGERDPEALLRYRELATGRERWAMVRAAPVFGERGHVMLSVNIFRDVTERVRMEEALREVRQAERGRIARDLHDRAL